MKNKTKTLKEQQLALWHYPKHKEKVARLREEQKLLRSGLLINNPKALIKKAREEKELYFDVNNFT